MPFRTVYNKLRDEANAETTLNITANTALKAAQARCIQITVVVAGSTTGAAYDCAATANEAAANLFFTIPNTLGNYYIDWPCGVGLCINPGTGMTVNCKWA